MANGWEITAAIASVLAVLVAVAFGYAQLRPTVSTHMGLGGKGVPLTWEFGKPFRSFVYIYNEGISAAKNVRFRGWCKAMTAEEVQAPNAFRDGRYHPDHDLSQTLHCGVSVAHYRSVTSDGIGDGGDYLKILKDDGLRMYVYGTVDYDDFLGIHHQKNFCVYFTDSSPTEYQWLQYERHNDSD